MLPVPVHERPCEERVCAIAHPVRERDARVVAGRDFHRAGDQSGRFHRLFRLLIHRRRDPAPMKNRVAHFRRRRLPADLREERREAVIVVLTPFLKRVMVALRTLHPHAEEKLRGIFKLLLRLLHLAIPAGGRILLHAARRRDHFAHEFVKRAIDSQAVAQPTVEGKSRGRVLRLSAFVAQQCAPFVREKVGVFRAVEQCVDEPVALGCVFVCEEAVRFLQRRKSPRDVECCTADKCRVVAAVRRRHSHRLELREHLLVHVVSHRRQRGHLRPKWHRRAERADLALIPHHDRHVSRLVEQLHAPCFIRFRHAFFVRFVERTARHILHRAIRVPGEHNELLVAAERHRSLLWKHLDALNCRVRRLPERHPLRHPPDEQRVVFRACIHALSTAVRCEVNRLRQQ